MLIVDAHVHIFEEMTGIKNGQPNVSGRYGKIKTGNTVKQFFVPSFERSNSTLEMLMAHLDCYGVEKAVLLPNIFYGYHNEYNLMAVQKYPERLCSLALVDVTKGEEAAHELDGLLENQPFLGLKIEVESAFQFRPDMLLDDRRMEPIWEVCERHHAIVMFHLYRAQDVDSLQDLVPRYKNIRFIFCHSGAEAVFENARSAADCENLTNIVRNNENAWYELSTTPSYLANEFYPFTQGSGYVEKLYQMLGAEKLIWGSDYPGMLFRATYKQLIDYVLSDCKNIPQDDMEKIMGKNSLELFF